MKVLGITGGIGAGKSTVLAYLEERYGARVIQADRVAYELQQPGQDCYSRIVRQFGPGILRADGQLDRDALSRAVFSDRTKLALLNQIVHPMVKRRIVSEIGRAEEEGLVPFAVVEAALLIEERYDQICDELWYIYASPSARRSRLMQSRGYSEEKVRRIMQNQLSDGEYRRNCKFVIDNSADFMENTYGQIDEGLRTHGFL